MTEHKVFNINNEFCCKGEIFFFTIMKVFMDIWEKKQRKMFANTKSVKMLYHYIDVIMSTMASQITVISIVYWTACSGADQRIAKATHNSPLWSESTSDWWILHTKGKLQGKWFHSMT